MVRQAKGDGKTHTVQESIPFRNMFPDGLCRLEGGAFSKTIAFEDVNYRLASPEDQRDIFEHLCDFYNGYDPTIGVQVSLSSRYVEHGPEEDLFGIRPQGDDLDPVREDAAGILRFQYERGSNGYVKTKYVTLTIEAENLPAARARFARIETDTLNRFKVMGAAAHVLDGKERLELLHGILHPADGRRPEGGKFAFDWDWLVPSGLSVKDFIAPSSFHFGETRTFRIGEMYGAVSFLQITAPEIHDRILAEFMETEGNILVTMHIRGINQNEAIKMVKRKITDLDGKDHPPGPAIPQRADVQPDLPGHAHGGDKAEAGDRRVPGGQRGADLQLPPHPAGLPAGGRADEQPPPGPQPYQNRTEPDHFGAGGIRALRHTGAVHGRGRHVLRPERPLQQHDPSGPQTVQEP